MPDYPPGTPMWVDLGTPDVDASIRFYGELFGWSASEPGPPEAGGYRFFEQEGKMVAGLGVSSLGGRWRLGPWGGWRSWATQGAPPSGCGSRPATPAPRSSTSRCR